MRLLQTTNRQPAGQNPWPSGRRLLTGRKGFTPVKSAVPTARRRYLTGFTLIEILIVCAIIAMLAAVAVVTYDKAKEKSRDATRVQDLETIANAFFLYYQDKGTYKISGTGLDGEEGAGWFNCKDSIKGTYRPNSIAQGLVDAGYVRNIIIDPSSDGSFGNPGYNYMFKFDDTSKKSTVYAKLENPTPSQTSTTSSAIYNGWIGSTLTPAYLRNYAKTISN